MCMEGYVLHNLHEKHVKATTAESRQAMAILKAAKIGSWVRLTKVGVKSESWKS